MSLPGENKGSLQQYQGLVHAGSARSHGTPLSGSISAARLAVVMLAHLGVAYAHPLATIYEKHGDSEASPDPNRWIMLTAAMALVLLGGAFAGLTIALMGQDEIYLQVIATSGEGSEKSNATKVLKLLKRGKHWVLVTLLVGNVITNETLPIVLDRAIGGGLAAAITSTALVIVFGEIVPQSICVRFGLPIGAWMANFVLVLMWFFSPVSWPVAKLLDYLLGEDHGTTYKKAGLKTLVTLHQTVGAAPGDRLNDDEVAIIKGVLDLKAKSVGSIMTPMNDVFTLSADAVLDEDMMNDVMREGYSRIPIHEPNNKGDFVGMLLVKMLITYDPEDARKVSEFSLATLPETRPETSCLDIINFFQEGKSHMVLVSNFPGESFGALGVVTLEDVIEELIGEEIIDESDVFIDVHKAIRRINPSPLTGHDRVEKGEIIETTEHDEATTSESLINLEEGQPDETKSANSTDPTPRKRPSSNLRPATFLIRSKTSNGAADIKSVQMPQYGPEMRERLKNLGPSNAAMHPKSTRVGTVKIKPGASSSAEVSPAKAIVDADTRSSIKTPPPSSAQDGIGQALISPGKDAKDGVKKVQANYGTWDNSPLRNQHDGDDREDSGGLVSQDSNNRAPKIVIERSNSQSTIGSLHSPETGPVKRSSARSGSITESVIQSGSVTKLVLEMTSSSEETDDATSNGEGPSEDQNPESRNTRRKTSTPPDGDRANGQHLDPTNSDAKGKKRKTKKKKKSKDGKDGESEPLLR